MPCVSTRIPVESFHQFTDFLQEGDDLTFFAVHANGWDLTLPLYPEELELRFRVLREPLGLPINLWLGGAVFLGILMLLFVIG